MRLALRFLAGGAAAFVALSLHRMWEAAARNNASPGAIVLLGLAGIAALVAVMAWVSVAVRVLRCR